MTEAKLAVLDGLPDIDTVMRAVEAVSAYVTGAIRCEIANLRAERATGPVQARLAARLRPARDENVGHRRVPALTKAVHVGMDVDAETSLRPVWTGSSTPWRPS